MLLSRGFCKSQTQLSYYIYKLYEKGRITRKEAIGILKQLGYPVKEEESLCQTGPLGVSNSEENAKTSEDL